MALELEGAQGHYRPLGEALAQGLDQKVVSDWVPCGENQSEKPDWGKVLYLMICTYCSSEKKERIKGITSMFKGFLMWKKYIKLLFRTTLYIVQIKL